jgi:molecular chaperone DnaK (HSP70)
MHEEKTLALQDYMLNLSKSDLNNGFAYWFEEIDNDHTDPKSIIMQYYEDNQGGRSDAFLETMTDMLLQITALDDWEEETAEALEEFGLTNNKVQVLTSLEEIVSEPYAVWRVESNKMSDIHREVDELEDDNNDDDPQIPWVDFLFKILDRYFVLHLGRK